VTVSGDAPGKEGDTGGDGGELPTDVEGGEAGCAAAGAMAGGGDRRGSGRGASCIAAAGDGTRVGAAKGTGVVAAERTGVKAGREPRDATGGATAAPPADRPLPTPLSQLLVLFPSRVHSGTAVGRGARRGRIRWPHGGATAVNGSADALDLAAPIDAGRVVDVAAARGVDGGWGTQAAAPEAGGWVRKDTAHRDGDGMSAMWAAAAVANGGGPAVVGMLGSACTCAMTTSTRDGGGFGKRHGLSAAGQAARSY